MCIPDGWDAYYQDDHVTILHADCLDVLRAMEDDSVACVVTSPPYNTLPTSGRVSGLHARRSSGVHQWVERAANAYPDAMPEEAYQDWLRDVVAECLRVSRGLVWVNHKVRYRDGQAIHPARFLPFPIYSEVIWDRGGSMALNCRRYYPSHECILGFGKPDYWSDNLNQCMSVWRISYDRGGDDHPCAYPETIPARLILSSCPPDEWCLDPFAGSGTTGRAAKDNNRRCLLIEREERYCETAAVRMSQGVLF